MEVQRKKEEHHYHGNGRVSLQARPHVPRRRCMRLVTLACACGCGEQFLPKRRNQKFVNAAHRLADHNVRYRLLRITEPLLDSIRSLEGGDRPTLDRVIGLIKRAANIEDDMPLWVCEGI
jgi:hypothetical protein